MNYLRVKVVNVPVGEPVTLNNVYVVLAILWNDAATKTRFVVWGNADKVATLSSPDIELLDMIRIEPLGGFTDTRGLP